MELTRYSSIEDFNRRTEPFLMEREAEHNLILGIAGAFMREPDRAAEIAYLATVEDDGEIVAAALLTSLNLIVSHVDDKQAIPVLAEDLRADHEALPGVVASVPFSKLFADEWERLTGTPCRLGMAQRIYQLKGVIPVTGVPGSLRHAAEGDRDLLYRWLAAFNAEALGETDTSRLEGAVNRYIAPGITGMYLWEGDHGHPVSMAAAIRPTPNGVVIGGVYTPPELRGRGYASACVAALSQLMLDRGKKYCFLYTDLANPTSNKIYTAMGYEPICDSEMYRFADETEQG